MNKNINIKSSRAEIKQFVYSAMDKYVDVYSNTNENTSINLDSFDCIEFVAKLEQRYNISITFKDARKYIYNASLGQIINYVVQKTQKLK